MISHSHRCIFIHIPKVAGQSIESAFLNQLGLTWEQREQLLLKKNSNRHKGPPRLAHLTAQEYTNLGYISQTDYESYFKFSFVRNPWSRLVSEYTYRQHPFSFKHFVLDYLPNCNSDDYQHYNGNLRHLIPQHQFLYSNQQCLVDFIGKFERIQADFTTVSQRVFGQAVQLPHRNKTHQDKPLIGKLFSKKHGKPYQSYFDTEMIEFTSKYYEKDIALFEYQFE
ncbi:hypothetical protein PSECIP111951_00682 [Pseudoalteromonas holothuriae]|uniref:Sulfotransferase family protein n=1 Tax=Pseudoalteromonas holothuriae TaxID=2963714 RepID=A0ABN8ULS1_9GAMM|nr:sulfotransferase family protein [Pseudoalteromonas sp. CIP111951]CAH9052753.1 hypothetical protein PSECIP111951_00682 [Pseudoalteromonas sp. CIP111951]